MPDSTHAQAVVPQRRQTRLSSKLWPSTPTSNRGSRRRAGPIAAERVPKPNPAGPYIDREAMSVSPYRGRLWPSLGKLRASCFPPMSPAGGFGFSCFRFGAGSGTVVTEHPGTTCFDTALARLLSMRR